MSKASDTTATAVPSSTRGYPGWLTHVAFLLLAVVVVLALLPLLPGWDGTRLHANAVLTPPLTHRAFMLGTDDLGRDLLIRLGLGAQVSLVVGLATAAVSLAIGTAYGLLAGLREGWLDTLLTRAVDVLYSLPGLLVVMLFVVALQPVMETLAATIAWLGLPGVDKLVALVLALSLFSWPDTARLVRGQTLALKREPFVEAYTSLGGGPWRLVWRQLLPNLLPVVLLSGMLIVPRAILTESTLSFIGLGMEPPLSSWGTLASEGWYLARVAPYLLVWPAAVILATMVALTVLGESLKHRLDRRLGS